MLPLTVSGNLGLLFAVLYLVLLMECNHVFSTYQINIFINLVSYWFLFVCLAGIYYHSVVMFLPMPLHL